MVSTVPESINGGLDCKTNQNGWYLDDAACIAGEGEEEMFLTLEPKLCVFSV